MKKSVLIIVLAVLLLMPLASAGFFDWITGKVSQSADTNITVQVITNNDPTLDDVIISTGTTEPNPYGSLSGQLQVRINFSASDVDGVEDINNTGSIVNMTYDLETYRFNESCSNVSNDVTNNQMNFTCLVTLYYYDISGDWVINVSVFDNSYANVTNHTEIFHLNPLSSVSLTPAEIQWLTMAAGSPNEEAGPTILNNTGNTNFTSITLNATHLVKEGSTEIIAIGNFSVNATSGATDRACTDMEILNDELTTIPTDVDGLNATLIRGRLENNNGDGQEEIYYCLDVPSGIASGTYSTKEEGLTRAWEIEVTA